MSAAAALRCSPNGKHCTGLRRSDWVLAFCVVGMVGALFYVWKARADNGTDELDETSSVFYLTGFAPNVTMTFDDVDVELQDESAATATSLQALKNFTDNCQKELERQSQWLREWGPNETRRF